MATTEPLVGQVIGCHTLDEWKTQFDQAVAAKKLVVIDFTASWCPPCRFIAPIFAEIAKKLPNVVFLKVDVDELKDLAEQFNVDAMPTFVLLKEGNEVERVVGASKDDLQAKISKHCGVALA